MCWFDPVHQNLECVVTRLDDIKQAAIWSLERCAVSVAANKHELGRMEVARNGVS